MADTVHTAKVVVFGNEKGGSGKTTAALHTTVALLRDGFKVASIDIDSKQRTFTRAIENRFRFVAASDVELPMPDHHCVALGEGDSISAREEQQFGEFASVINRVEKTHDFVVVDTPGMDNALVRLIHAMADTLVTPMNDSFIDLDLLASGDLSIGAPVVPSQYSQLVENARRQRRQVDGGQIDWMVVPNRLTQIQSRNKVKVREMLEHLSSRLGFRIAMGISERTIFREFFPIGVTVFDPVPMDAFGVKRLPTHESAREEVRKLITAMGLKRKLIHPAIPQDVPNIGDKRVPAPLKSSDVEPLPEVSASL